ncbi:hypothetical protein ACFQXB_02955 [Plastorhodobacter daqingensis]|uniref:O-antigen polysaccharide polymerase Wzy n=1 Tax=Plastorhodobacter daqingensis TaxID=1387281 RepID=A0ABW2UIC3_9RHOB
MAGPGALTIACGLLVAWHIGLGSDPFMLAVMALISMLGFYRLVAGRLWFGDLLVAGGALYSGFLPLIIKGALGQPLQTNLHHPQEAAGVMLSGFLVLWCLAAAARTVARGRARFPLTDCYENPELQGRLFLPLLGSGLLILGLHVALRPRMVDAVLQQGPGFGGFGSFTFLLILALALGVSRTMRGQGGRAVLAAAGAALLLMALASNTRREFAEFVLVLAAGLLIYRQRPGLPMAIGAAVAGAVLLLYVAPLIHLMRGQTAGLGLVGRLELAFNILVDHRFSPGALRLAEAQFLTGFGYAWSENGSYIWPSTRSLDRFMLILPIDQVLRGLAQNGPIGLTPFLREIAEGVLPSLFIQKTNAVGADLVAWEHGIRQYGNAARPVIGFTASALAAAGMWGVVLLPVLIAFPLMLTGNLIFGPLAHRAIGIFLLAQGWILPEMTFDALAVFALRPFVLMLIVLWLLARRGPQRLRVPQSAGA